jgi:acetyltransferase-like isoleucine patch superfamily enzyme
MVKVTETLQEWWWKIRWSSRATALLHVLAMYAPFNSWRILFYRLRGTKIGKGVYIVQGAFLEESRPWLIEIQDGARIGVGVIIVTHDAVYHEYDTTIPHRYGKVIIKQRASICPGSIILPGVTIGECAVVAPGSVVNKDVPPHTIVSGKPAQHLMTLEEGLTRSRNFVDTYNAVDKATKYPWLVR